MISFPASRLLLTALPAVVLAQTPQQLRHVERVEVARVIVDARVVDDGGSPLVGLTDDDFRVLIDGKPARLESARWMAEGRGEPDPSRRAPSQAIERAAEPFGRSIVFLFQKDLEESRIVGLMAMLGEASAFLDRLSPEDRVAIFSFDFHLKLWTDFTEDRDRARRVLKESILFGDQPPPEDRLSPALAIRFDPEEGRRAATIERALLLIGRALEPMPGAKSLLFFGWGFGSLSWPRIIVDEDYGAACRVLAAARTAVFSLDVTRADYHTLEAGLQHVAEATGGFYAKTHLFPKLAIKRLEGALAGYYLLSVEKPALPAGSHRIKVELTRARGTVLARSSYAD
jgi:VWFA-related protein